MAEEKIIKDVIKKYDQFLKSNNDLISEIDSDYNSLIKLVTSKFTKDNFESLTLEKYCIGKGNEESFSYLLERGTEKLGNIRGATASKFGVYYSQKENGYKYTSKFTDEHNAINSISDSISSIANAEQLNVVEEDEILSHMFKYKIFYIYNPDKLIPIFSENLLKNSITDLGLQYTSYTNAQVELIQIFNKVKQKDKSTLNFMYFILGKYSLKNIINNIISKLTLEEEQAYNILISLSISNFLIFSGPSGIGKTSIVKKISEELGGLYEKVSVKSNFTDESSVLGYWNPLLGKYEGTEVLKFLIKSGKKPDVLSILLLDEMNLSKVENYFSTFLSEIDNLNSEDESKITLFETQITTKKQYENIKYFLDTYFEGEYGDHIILGNEDEDLKFSDFYSSIEYIDEFIIKNDDIKNIRISLSISPNLKVIGTINEDETTQVLSNKVLDRAQFINFEVGDLFGTQSISKIDTKISDRSFYTLSKLDIEIKNLENDGNKSFGKSNFTDIKTLLNDLNKQIQIINVNESIGYRSLEELLNYMLNYIGKSKTEIDNALDNQIAQKVLPKLKAFSLLKDTQKKAFEDIGIILSDRKLTKSIKMYEYLKNNSSLDD